MQIDTIGEKIRMYRNYKGYSQEGLAKISGVSQSQISFIEKNRNKKKCDEVVLNKLSKALDISTENLQNFGDVSSDIYGSAVKDLNSKEKLLLQSVLEDEKGFGNMLSIFEVFTKIISNYKTKLDECEKKNLSFTKNRGGGKSKLAYSHLLYNYSLSLNFYYM